MEQLRTVQTQWGEISYTLTKKRVKNLNLRVDTHGTVSLSVPLRCSLHAADEFVIRKSAWIVAHRKKKAERPVPKLLPELGREACFALLERSLERMYPLVAVYGVGKPVLKIRKMRTQWGNCHWMQGYITLNTALHRCPEHLRDYVALHELVHFLHHDHGSGFYASMDAIMPEWREYRRELRLFDLAVLD